MLDGLPGTSRRTWAMSSPTSGSTGVVAAWSRYTRRMSESLGANGSRRARETHRIRGRVKMPLRADVGRWCLGPGELEQGRRARLVARLRANGDERRAELDDHAAHRRPRDHVAIRKCRLDQALCRGPVSGCAPV